MKHLFISAGAACMLLIAPLLPAAEMADTIYHNDTILTLNDK